MNSEFFERNFDLLKDSAYLEHRAALLRYYEAATIALHASSPTEAQWRALDEAGAACEALLGVPEEARK